jgi:hypothetical protein
MKMVSKNYLLICYYTLILFLGSVTELKIV